MIMKVLHNSCNTVTCALPDMSTLGPVALGPDMSTLGPVALGCTYQAEHSCLCYNY